jgi:hypothetical protein
LLDVREQHLGLNFFDHRHIKSKAPHIPNPERPG